MAIEHHQTRCTTIRIAGMTCRSCEILLERTLRGVSGVLDADVNFRTGEARLTARANALPSLETVEAAVRRAGYRLAADIENTARDRHKWIEIAGALVVILALYKLLQVFDLVSLAPSTSGALTLGGVFVVGLVAGTSSCLAVTGGLLLSMAAKYNETHRHVSPWDKFRPLLHFNVGRLASYFVLGGLIGLLGQTITLSPKMTGLMNIVIAMVMVYLGLSILHLVPRGSCPIRFPKRFTRAIANLTESKHPAASAGLGAMTFFLPCGFTQSLQLVALASGSFLTGALTMFTFALGTLPSLLGISALSSTAHGMVSRLFLRFSGALVLMLALFNLNSGFLLTGIDLPRTLAAMFGVASSPAGDVPALRNGIQEISMAVTSYGYTPENLTIRAGLPVRWTIDGSQAQGCTSVLVVPALNITKPLTVGDNVVEFTAPTKPGRLAFSCGMGMVHGSITVLSPLIL